MIKEIVFFLSSLATLIISGIFLVDSLNKLSKHLKLSEFRAAFVIVAIATSIPELMIGISSAIEKSPIISLGNILGAGILNLTLVTGLFVLLNKGISIKKEKTNEETYFMLSSVILLIILSLAGRALSRIDGLILTGLFSFNIYYIFKKKKKKNSREKNTRKRKSILIDYVVFSVSLIFLIVSSKYAVHYSILLADLLGIAKVFIGLFVISFGTVLPELVFGIDAVLLKHGSMSIGNQIGTVFSNITLILGIVSIISPITINFVTFFIPAFFLLVSALMFSYFQKTKEKLTIKEALVLILFYILFVYLMMLIENKI